MTTRINKVPSDLGDVAVEAIHRSRLEAPPDSAIWTADELILDDTGPKRVARALLTGFAFAGEPLRLGPITVRNPSEATDQSLQEYGRSYDRTCVLELRYRERRNASSVYGEPRRLLEVAFIALQMTVDAWVGSSVAHHYDQDGAEVGVSGGPRTATADSWHPGGDAVVTADQAFAKRIQTAITAQTSPLANAVQRFSKGCSNLINDSIVDFAIVLDALLGYGIRDEITHRVASRGAHLLDPGTDERLHRYLILKYLYGCRSKFVHEAANDVPKPSGKERLALKAFGVDWRDDAGTSLNRYHVADLARRTTRAVLWKFANGEAQLDLEWLNRLELGLIQP
jgi:hypothetical protein